MVQQTKPTRIEREKMSVMYSRVEYTYRFEHRQESATSSYKGLNREEKKKKQNKNIARKKMCDDKDNSLYTLLHFPLMRNKFIQNNKMSLAAKHEHIFLCHDL